MIAHVMSSNPDSTLASHRIEIRKLLPAVHCRMLAVFVIAAIVVNTLLPKAFTTLLDNEEFSRIIASESVLADFFYTATLPMKIVDRMLQQGMAGISGRKAGSCPVGNQENKPNTSNESVASVSSTGGLFRSFGALAVSGAVHFIACSSCFCSETLLKGCHRCEAPVFLAVMIAFIFLLPRSSINSDGLFMPVIQSIIPGSSNLEPGVFLLENTIYSATGRLQ